ncbi:hypothetical protein ScPMuIL_005360 [Solemya velum]
MDYTVGSREDLWIFPITEIVCLGITNGVFLAIGIPGNILAILSTIRMKNCTIKQLLMNFSISHLIYMFILPLTYTMRWFSEWVFGELLCKFLPYVEVLTLVVCPSATLVVISLERCLYFWFAEILLYTRKLCNPIMVILVIWVISAILSMPLTFLKVIADRGDSWQYCEVTNHWHSLHVYRMCLLVVPCTLMAVLYILSYYKQAYFWRNVEERRKRSVAKDFQRKIPLKLKEQFKIDVMFVDEFETKQGLNILVVISTIHFVCLGPSITQIFLIAFRITIAISEKKPNGLAHGDTNIPNINVLSLINSAIRPT